MGRKKQIFNPGDVFLISLPDANFALGQVVSCELSCMDSVLCVFFKDKFETEQVAGEFAPSLSDVLSVQLTTRDLLDLGTWKIVKASSPLVVESIFPINELRKKGYVGAKIRGSKIMTDLVCAYHGLEIWDDYADPNYLDSLLAPGVHRPTNAALKQR